MMIGIGTPISHSRQERISPSLARSTNDNVLTRR
jgi:hypothetical protein